MKLKAALKKFKFLKRLNLPDPIIEKLATQLAGILRGSETVFFTPLAEHCDPIEFLVDWDIHYEQNLHRINGVLSDLEESNKAKFGPRSIAEPWSERRQGLKSSFDNQDIAFISHLVFTRGPGNRMPIDHFPAIRKLKLDTSSGLPFLKRKSECLDELLVEEYFYELLERNDQCMLYTRTTEGRKTRDVWGYPIAATLDELKYYIPLLNFQRNLYYRAALVSPHLVSVRISEMIHKAMREDKLLYSVDFKGFDKSVRYQHIIQAFEYVKSVFDPLFHEFIDEICHRMCTIGIVTPTGIYQGYHGVPSGSTFTNEIDSIVQFGVASTLHFISALECMIQGDDGVYMLKEENVKSFEKAFSDAKLILETSKSHLAPNYVIFCQNLYHIDYQDENGFIGGIYPIYRAITRLMYHDSYVSFKKIDMSPKDYYNIRTITLLENCKYHPLFEDFVRFVVLKDKFLLDVSESGIIAYQKYVCKGAATQPDLNHQYGTQVSGIRDFESYKLIKAIRAEEESKVE